jgi:hypothetical protein
MPGMYAPSSAESAELSPRPCWVCGKVMRTQYQTYYCDPCDLQEKLVYVNNRNDNPQFTHQGKVELYVDHVAMDVPSPDCDGWPRVQGV